MAFLLHEFIEQAVRQAFYEMVAPAFDSPGESYPLTMARQAHMNRAFMAWFGNSKVVDKHGDPLPVYHGTTKDFDVFSKDKTNTSGTGISTNHLGFFFTSSSKVASIYASKQFNPAKGFKPGSHVDAYFLKISKPFYITEKQYWNLSRMAPQEIGQYVLQLKSKGYDGIIMPSVWRGSGMGYDFVAFETSQIKSLADAQR